MFIISHQSALEYWRVNRDIPIAGAQRRRNVTLPVDSPAIGLLKETGLTPPLHIMVGNPGARRLSLPAKQHIFRGGTPAGCFINAGDGYMVSSPEFLYLQMANQLSLIGLIELGYELCGTYSRPTDGEQTLPIESPYNHAPLTSKERLKAFAKSMPGTKGHQNAVRALRYIQDSSASPMETKLTLLLTLPYKLGGYNIPMPELNRRFDPVKSAKRVSSKDYYTCDLSWPDFNLVVEYDSDLFHTSPERIAEDAKKKNALASIDVTPITVTRQQIRSTLEFEKIARLLAGKLGKKLQYKNPGFGAAHRELRKQLF